MCDIVGYYKFDSKIANWVIDRDMTFIEVEEYINIYLKMI